MITTRTKSRLEGVDTTGDRWATHRSIGDTDRLDRVTIRTIDGNVHLDHADAAALAAWLGIVVDGTP